MDSYLKMMKHMADLYRQYETQMTDIAADTVDFAGFIKNLDESRFHQMMAGIPKLFGSVVDPLFGHQFALKDLKRLTETDNRWAEVIGVTKNMPLHMDLTDPAYERRAFETAALLMDLYPEEDELRAVDRHIVIEQQKHPVMLHLGSKLALSKMSLKSLSAPIFSSFVVAMYKENNRIRTITEHPAGEDFLRRKVAQLKWLFEGEIDKKWELVFVDDGCPEKSGEIAESIIRQEGYSNVRVLFLADAIAEGSPVAKGLTSTDDSQKGGAIQYGMWSVIREQHDNARHIVIYTDSDLSTNIAQAGLLLHQLENQNRMCTIGTRYDTGGVYCTPVGAQGLTNYDHTMLVFRHFIRTKLLPQLGEVVDTQCGFKAFKAEVLKKMLERMTDKRFSFDMELLLLTALHSGRGGI
ncbi:MAG: glycosyltransferase family 2 protein [Deltaproteobacteria bacterium]|nr:glycosyltransferase family 2 protein [Deltaproteobacteria bacterium]